MLFRTLKWTAPPPQKAVWLQISKAEKSSLQSDLEVLRVQALNLGGWKSVLSTQPWAVPPGQAGTRMSRVFCLTGLVSVLAVWVNGLPYTVPCCVPWWPGCVVCPPAADNGASFTPVDGLSGLVSA